MRSIITLTGSDLFPRVKIGIGQKPHPDYDLAAWVLSHFSKDEAPRMLEAARSAAEEDRIDDAMNRYSQ